MDGEFVAEVHFGVQAAVGGSNLHSLGGATAPRLAARPGRQCRA